MATDKIIPPPLAPELADLLTTTERDVLRAIVRDGDIVDGFKARLLNGAHGAPDDLDEDAGDAWLLVRLSPAMLDALAAFEADDADLEAEPDLELDHDGEPSLGATSDMNQEKAWRAPEVYGIDLEFDGDGVPDADAEPMLASPENHPATPWFWGGELRDRTGDQTSWARGFGLMEEEDVNEDGGAIDDEGHGDTFEETSAGAGDCNDEPSLGATVAFDQRQAWAASEIGVTDGEATGTIDDLEAPWPTIEQREAQSAAARAAADKVRAMRLRKSPSRSADVAGSNLIPLGPCDALGRLLHR
jgi:hypothetical protein